MNTRVLVVGINPSYSKTKSITLKRLYNWMDQMGIDIFSFVNCIGRPGNYTHKDIEYDLLTECTRDYTKVLALGNFPSSALNKINVRHYTLPHPSGLNRKLNDKHYELSMLKDLRNYLNEH